MLKDTADSVEKNNSELTFAYNIKVPSNAGKYWRRKLTASKFSAYRYLPKKDKKLYDGSVHKSVFAGLIIIGGRLEGSVVTDN
jgi:hypothetical protein